MRVLLHAENGKLEGGFKFGCGLARLGRGGNRLTMRDVGFGHSLDVSVVPHRDRQAYKTSRTDESLKSATTHTHTNELTSSLTGFRVKPSPTNVALLTIRFQLFPLCLPVLMTLNISSSAIPLTLGRGTAYFAARSFRRSLIAELSAFASWCELRPDGFDPPFDPRDQANTPGARPL